MSVAVALTFVWLGLVLALSFMEAPLKFRAPGVTRELGLGIGRLIFKALNALELLLVVLVAVFVVADDGAGALDWPYYALVAILGIQTVMLYGFMDKRAARIVAGEPVPPSRQHYAYIVLEVAKLGLLITLGTLLLKEIAG